MSKTIYDSPESEVSGKNSSAYDADGSRRGSYEFSIRKIVLLALGAAFANAIIWIAAVIVIVTSIVIVNEDLLYEISDGVLFVLAVLPGLLSSFVSIFVVLLHVRSRTVKHFQ